MVVLEYDIIIISDNGLCELTTEEIQHRRQ